MSQKTFISLSGVQKTEDILSNSNQNTPELVPYLETIALSLPQNIIIPPATFSEPNTILEEDSTTFYPKPAQDITTLTLVKPVIQFKKAQRITLSSSFWESVNASTHRIKAFDKAWVGAVIVAVVIGCIFCLIYLTSNKVNAAPSKQATNLVDQQAYKKWSEKYFGKIVAQSEDSDSDQLSNLEEFEVGSDPTKFSTCNTTKGDSETLYDLIDVTTCKKIDFTDDGALKRITQVIDLKLLNQQMASKSSVAAKVNSGQVLESILNEKFLSKDQIETAQQQIDQQKKYALLVEKVASYTAKYRSFGPFDRNYDMPVIPETYLRVSLQYDVPMKYMMAVARFESRFGTDRFTDSGNETRGSRFKNMYSIGLDDSGGNIGYVNWDDGVVAFGKWYKNFQDKNISDCNKWRIFNPNGDYCSKVEGEATYFENFVAE